MIAPENTWLTETLDGQWAGPDIIAKTFKEAQVKARGGLRVVGEVRFILHPFELN